MSSVGVIHIVTLLVLFVTVSVSRLLDNKQPRADCIVTSYADLNDAVSNCTDITIRGITVPAGAAIDVKLKDGSTLTFEGHITFEYKEWDGPLVHIEGNAITVQGAAGHVLDGQGIKYWDGQGGNGGKIKPRAFTLQATGGSIFKNINFLNCPRHCVSISKCDGVMLSNWTVDSSAGDKDSLGHNTDGFGISSSSNVRLENSVVKNQDDCVVVNHGTNITITGVTCSGGHGLSFSVGQSSSPESNTVSNVIFSDSTVLNSRNGIHIKTHADGGTGSISNIIYYNITLSGITVYGINIQEDYENGDSTGIPNNNVPITNLIMKDISISLADSHAAPVYIMCAPGGCSNWEFSDIVLHDG